MFQAITHVIYDMDGLLLDTESLNEQVNGEIVQRYGKTFTTEIKIAIAGTTAINSAKTIIETLKLPLTVDEYLQARNKLLYPLYSHAKTFPGTVELIQHLANHNIPQAIATSSSRQNFEMKTVNHQDWLKHFELFTLGDDPEIRQGKPAPDIFLLTAKRLNAKPQNCLVFEDSLSGMKAAIAAGMSVVVVPDPVYD
ncbi:MAG: HAD-IA family hydrolase [Pleurocapsa sp.]